MITYYVQIKRHGKHFVYLEKAKFVRAGKFISGYQINKFVEPILNKGGDIIHLIELGPEVKVINMAVSQKYGWLEKADPATGRNRT